MYTYRIDKPMHSHFFDNVEFYYPILVPQHCVNFLIQRTYIPTYTYLFPGVIKYLLYLNVYIVDLANRKMYSIVDSHFFSSVKVIIIVILNVE